MNWCELINCFDFNENLATDDEISSIATIQFYSFKFHGYRNLPFKMNSAKAQFAAETNPVCRFKQSGAECAGHFDAQPITISVRSLAFLLGSVFSVTSVVKCNLFISKCRDRIQTRG